MRRLFIPFFLVLLVSSCGGSSSAAPSITIHHSSSHRHPYVVFGAGPSAPEAGDVLFTSNGNWSSSPTDYAYQWQDCDSNGANCANITTGSCSGACTNRYVIQASDVSFTIRSQVTASFAATPSATISSSPTAVVTAGANGNPPAGVTLTAADGGANYYGNWTSTFPNSPSFVPTGVFLAEDHPSTLAAEGLNYFTPMRNDNVGQFCPTWSASIGNGMNDVNAVPGFYSGAAFYTLISGQQWGPQAAFEVYGDELDGNSNNYFESACVPPSIRNNTATNGAGGLSTQSFLNDNTASHTLDPTRPVYLQTTSTFIDGGLTDNGWGPPYNDFHYTVAQKQQICASSDIFSFDIYPIVQRSAPVWVTYDNVIQAETYCQHNRPILPFIEMDHQDVGTIYPTPIQTRSEVWFGIIGGARGTQYFDQFQTITDQAFTCGGGCSAGGMYNAIKATNAQVKTFSPLINGSFASGYVTNTTVGGSGNVMAEMVKWEPPSNSVADARCGNSATGCFYLFTGPRFSSSQTATYTFVKNSSCPATIKAYDPVTDATGTLASPRTINVSVSGSNCQFSDTVASATNIHIYVIPNG